MKAEVTLKECYYTQIETPDFNIMIFDEDRVNEKHEPSEEKLAINKEIDSKNEYFARTIAKDEGLQNFLSKFIPLSGFPITVKFTHVHNHMIFGCFDRFEVYHEYSDEVYIVRLMTPHCRSQMPRGGEVRFF